MIPTWKVPAAILEALGVDITDCVSATINIEASKAIEVTATYKKITCDAETLKAVSITRKEHLRLVPVEGAP